MRSLTEFEVWGPAGSPAQLLHDGLVKAQIVESEALTNFGDTAAKAMQQLERRTRETYGKLKVYKDNLQVQAHALPADPDHPLIWEVATDHLSDLLTESPSEEAGGDGDTEPIAPHELARRAFLIRNVLAILAQTPQDKRLLAAQLNVSVLHFKNEDSVGLMYWHPDRNRITIRLRQRNPVRLREVTQLLVTIVKRIGNAQLGNPEAFKDKNSAAQVDHPQPLRFQFEPIQLFTHSVGKEEEVDRGEVVQFDNAKSVYIFIWRRRVERLARLAVYVTALLSIALFVAQIFIGGSAAVIKTMEFSSQTFGRLFTTALWVIFLQIFVEHGSLINAMRSKGAAFTGGAIVLWGNAKRYSMVK